MSIVRYLQVVLLVSHLTLSIVAQSDVNFQNFKFVMHEDVVHNNYILAIVQPIVPPIRLREFFQHILYRLQAPQDQIIFISYQIYRKDRGRLSVLLIKTLSLHIITKLFLCNLLNSLCMFFI